MPIGCETNSYELNDFDTPSESMNQAQVSYHRREITIELSYRSDSDANVLLKQINGFDRSSYKKLESFN